MQPKQHIHSTVFIMIKLRAAAERGYADHGWLQARHSFSFADYYDAAQMGWGVLRVINEDRIAPDSGFGTHGHRDMEIVTWLIDGELEHRDSLGNGGVLRPGEVQRMSAGSGIRHSEFNPSPSASTHLLQIWLRPAQAGGQPSWEQRSFAPALLDDRLQPIATPDGAAGSTTIAQDARVYASRPAAGSRLVHALAPGRLGWVQVVAGRLTVNGVALVAGDGAALADETQIEFQADEAAEFLFFDLPPESI